MDYSKAYAVAAKDLKEAFSSISIYGPMIVIPLFFAITLPVFTIYISTYSSSQIVSRILGVPVAQVQSPSISRFYFVDFFSINILGPIFLTMPIITASVIAADSFAGEKERKTAESLLATPISDFELLLGKILASLIPAIILTIAIFLIYAGITNYLTLSSFNMLIFPNTSWYMMLLNAPFLALTTIGLVVLVSARVKGIKEAQQISALLILPILVIPFISIFNVADLTFVFFSLMLITLIITSSIVLYISVKLFDRERFIVA
jgi:ABC-type Na+ efflux pump permease subunit